MIEASERATAALKVIIEESDEPSAAVRVFIQGFG